MNNSWLCVECGLELGEVQGGELVPSEKVPQANLRTRGPNLAVTCPNCGSVKTWYTADPIVRALYQLIDAMVTVAAKRMVTVLSEQTLPNKERR